MSKEDFVDRLNFHAGGKGLWGCSSGGREG